VLYGFKKSIDILEKKSILAFLEMIIFCKEMKFEAGSAAPKNNGLQTYFTSYIKTGEKY
jgi:hypothetical protein